MRHPSAVLFAALMMWGNMSPVFACRSANNATIVKPSIDSLVAAGVDQYNTKVNPDLHQMFRLASGPSHDSGFCVNLSIVESSDFQNAETGVVFWSTADMRSNIYFLYIRDNQYRIMHMLFGKEYDLVPWTTDASIKKGLRQQNEVDVRVTATGADIQINGTELIPIIARPSADAQYYGVVFYTPKGGAGLFQMGSPRIVK
jgi:hypothetical protein